MRYVLKDRFVEAEQAKFNCEIVINGTTINVRKGDFIIMKGGCPPRY